jgi:hypothetical protein
MKLPFLQQPGQRSSLLNQDDIQVNCFGEGLADGRRAVVKRPGVASHLSPAAASTPRGMWLFNGQLVSVFGTSLYHGTTLVTSSLTGTGPVWAEEVGTASRYLMVSNGTNAWVLDTSWGLSRVNDIVCTGATFSSPDITFNTSVAHHLTALSKVTSTGWTESAYNAASEEIKSVTSTSVVIDPTGSDPGGASTVTGTISPAGWQSHVAGIAHLDGYLFTMSSGGQINHSDLRDPWNWHPANTINAEAVPDGGVAIARHFNYVAALGPKTLEFFYDAANTSGSVLNRVSGSIIYAGCASARTLATLKGILFYVSDGGKVYAVENMAPSRISSPAIERILQAADFSDATAQAFEIPGHTLYVLTLPTSNITLACDLSTKQWFQMQDADGNYWPYHYAVQDGQEVYIQGEDGIIYTVSGNQDAGADFEVLIRTPFVDFGTSKRKRMARVTVVADYADGTLYLRYSDNDYRTWTQKRGVSLSRRPEYRGLGAFERRALEFSHKANEPLRLIEVDLELL